jgi:hypothetical protein
VPQVPIVQGRSVREAPLQGGFQRAPDRSGIDNALSTIGNAADRITERIDSTAAYEAEAQVKTQWLATDAELRKKYRGVNAPGYLEEVDKFWGEAGKNLGGALSPRAKAMVGKSLTASQLQAKASAQGFVAHETERAQDEAYTSSQLAEIQRGVASGDPAVAAVSVTLLKQRNAEQAQRKGWDKATLDDANTKATTALHANMIQGMVQKDPTAALAYFNANKGEIDGTRHAEIERALTVASAANDGDQAAKSIWGTLGPKGYNDPVSLDKMDAAARELYPNDPVRRKAATDALRERATLHNAAQAENNAAAVNQVMGVYNKTKSLAAMKRSPAWAAMPAQKQAEVETYVTNMQYSVLQRANAADARVDAAEAREQRKMQRDGFAAYLVYSQPENLAKMSDAQVQALLPTLGNDLTNHLIEKKRHVAKSPLSEAEAKMDKQDFDHVADSMGLKPYAKKSEEEKAQLGELQYRVEQLIYSAQQEKGKALTRQEKTELMRVEMARKVKVDGGWFSSDTEKSVLQLTKDDIADVIVPPADRAQIVDAMKSMFDKTKSPLFAPNEANLKRFYLLNQSRAANLLPLDSAQ